MNRRSFLLSAGGVVAHPLLNSLVASPSGLLYAAQQSAAQQTAPKNAPSKPPLSKPDHSLTIQPCTLEISPGVNIKTIAYNGQVPGPLLRLRQGLPVTIDVTNTTGNEDIVHWHGLTTDPLNDGAMEEGSPMIPAGGILRYHLTPNPAGSRWYHTHVSAGANLALGTYTGQFGFLLVEGSGDPGHYDQEIFLAIHHWQPSFVPMVETMQAESANHPMTSGSDVGYQYATINQQRLGAGEPLRVKQGQRVLLRLLNASATENVVLALPGHTFRVIAMDGNPVPNPREVEVVSLAVAERVDAIVEMNRPGVWILGALRNAARQAGMGIVVEYADQKQRPQWLPLRRTRWDYTIFGKPSPHPAPDQTIDMVFEKVPGGPHGINHWLVNGKEYPHEREFVFRQGRRYRLVFHNRSDDSHPLHIHRHLFELVELNGKPTAGIMKDTVIVPAFGRVTVDLVADQPGLTLFHCHIQQHMDFGFKALFRYA